MTDEPLCDYLRRHHTGMVVAGMRDRSERIGKPGDRFDMGDGVVVELVDLDEEAPYYPPWWAVIGSILLGAVILAWACI